jgi:hypothetical protein
MVGATDGASDLRRSSHQPSPARAAPIIGPNARRARLLPATPESIVPKL